MQAERKGVLGPQPGARERGARPSSCRRPGPWGGRRGAGCEPRAEPSRERPARPAAAF